MLMLLLMLLPGAAPGQCPMPMPVPAPCPCPMPRTGCSRRFLVVNRHRHTVPEYPVYLSTRVSAATLPTHWLRPHPKTIHQSRYRTKTDWASSRSLSMADAWPLGTVRARARLVLPRLIDAGSVLPRTMTIGHWTPEMGSADNVGPEASECSSYRVAGSSNSEREKKKGIALV